MVATKCRCTYFDCPKINNGTCYLEPGGYCYTYYEEVLNRLETATIIEKHFGCFESGDSALFQCKGYLTPHLIKKNISCCNSNDYCNDELLTEIQDGEIQKYFNEFFIYDYFDLLVCIGMFFIVLFLLTILFMIIKQRKREEVKTNTSNENLLSTTPISSEEYSNDNIQVINPYVPYIPINIAQSSDSDSNMISFNYSQLSSTVSNTTSSLMSEKTQQTTLSVKTPNSLSKGSENSITSGSGSGLPRLMQRTLSHEIELIKSIGKGRFGRVWHGVKHYQSYAVKIYSSRHERTWKHEIDIHENINLRHENIVAYFGSDIHSFFDSTQLWLVMEYHELGSLYDFLNKYPIRNIPQMLNLMRSIIFGLSHLHAQIDCAKGKPMIAHRDLKSKNILMKSQHCCCISDFSLAAVQNPNENDRLVNFPLNHTGTPLYMAPEMLKDINKSRYFKEFLMADIYSLGLVFWEMFNRLQIFDNVNDYSIPYKEHVLSEDPSIEEMKHVLINKIRPIFNIDFTYDPILFNIAELINECWTDNPNARLSSLYVKKKILNLMQCPH